MSNTALLNEATENIDKSFGDGIRDVLSGEYPDSLPIISEGLRTVGVFGPLTLSKMYKQTCTIIDGSGKADAKKLKEFTSFVLKDLKNRGVDLPDDKESQKEQESATRLFLQMLAERLSDARDKVINSRISTRADTTVESDRRRPPDSAARTTVVSTDDGPHMWRVKAYEAQKFQTGGSSLPFDLRPKNEHIELIHEHAREGQIAPISSIVPEIYGRNADLKKISVPQAAAGFELYVEAHAVAGALPAGTGPYKSFKNTSSADEILALDENGDAIRPMMHTSLVRSVTKRVSEFVTGRPAPTVAEAVAVLSNAAGEACKECESEHCTLTRPFTTIVRRGFCTGEPSASVRKQAKAPMKPKASIFRPSRASRDQSSESDSESESACPQVRRSPRAHKSSKSSAAIKSKKKVRYADSSSSSSDDEPAMYDPSWGGNPRSRLVCFAQCFDKDGCTKRHCDFSHRPSLVDAERAKHRKGDRSSSSKSKTKK